MGTTLDVAQIRTNSSHELQYKLQRKLRLRTYNRIPRTYPAKHPGHQTCTQTRMEERRQRRPNRRTTEKIAELHKSAKDNLMQSYLKYKSDIMTRKQKLRLSESMTTVTSSIRKQTINQRNSHSKTAFGQDLT